MPSSKPLFSILIPSIPSRIEKFLIPLYSKLENMSKGYPVEILSFIDNKNRSIGLKRDALVQMARGDYLAFVDDDDDVDDSYVSSILDAINKSNGADIITFKQKASIDGENIFTVDFSIMYENEDAKKIDDVWIDIKRQPFHICVWKSEIAKKHSFPDASYGEDWHWAERALKDVKVEFKIDKHLHEYKYNIAVTEAALDFAK